MPIAILGLARGHTQNRPNFFFIWHLFKCGKAAILSSVNFLFQVQYNPTKIFSFSWIIPIRYKYLHKTKAKSKPKPNPNQVKQFSNSHPHTPAELTTFIFFQSFSFHFLLKPVQWDYRTHYSKQFLSKATNDTRDVKPSGQFLVLHFVWPISNVWHRKSFSLCSFKLFIILIPSEKKFFNDIMYPWCNGFTCKSQSLNFLWDLYE